MLNLFEMAYRFRKQDIIESEVFGSWVIWMWSLCDRTMFQQHWPGERGLEYNYVMEFRELINAGIYFATELPKLKNSEAPTAVTDELRRRSFFRYVAQVMNDQAFVEHWLDMSTTDVEKFKRYWAVEIKPFQIASATQA